MYKLKDWIDKNKILLLKGSKISLNPNAISLLEKNQDKINGQYLLMNPNPNAIPLLEADSSDKNYWLPYLN